MDNGFNLMLTADMQPGTTYVVNLSVDKHAIISNISRKSYAFLVGWKYSGSIGIKDGQPVYDEFAKNPERGLYLAVSSNGHNIRDEDQIFLTDVNLNDILDNSDEHFMTNMMIVDVRNFKKELTAMEHKEMLERISATVEKSHKSLYDTVHTHMR